MEKPFEILFNDGVLIVLNKLAKIVVVPTPKKEKTTLTTLVTQRIHQPVFPCHRLDRETSGIIVYAASKNIQQAVMEQFRRGKVTKKYIAFVKGRMHSSKGTLRGTILDIEGKRYGEKPKKALTRYKLLKVRKSYSIIQLEPLTGRTNQLRIQLAKRGNPILGESKYAFRRDFPLRFKRLALHAFFISFFHPVSGKPLVFEISLADDMEAFMERFP